MQPIYLWHGTPERTGSLFFALLAGPRMRTTQCFNSAASSRRPHNSSYQPHNPMIVLQPRRDRILYRGGSGLGFANRRSGESFG